MTASPPEARVPCPEYATRGVDAVEESPSWVTSRSVCPLDSASARVTAAVCPSADAGVAVAAKTGIPSPSSAAIDRTSRPSLSVPSPSSSSVIVQPAVASVPERASPKSTTVAVVDRVSATNSGEPYIACADRNVTWLPCASAITRSGASGRPGPAVGTSGGSRTEWTVPGGAGLASPIVSAKAVPSYATVVVGTVSRSVPASGPSGTVTVYVYDSICCLVFERASPKPTTMDVGGSPTSARGIGGAPSTVGGAVMDLPGTAGSGPSARTLPSASDSGPEGGTVYVTRGVAAVSGTPCAVSDAG